MSKNHSNVPETLFVGKNVISLEQVNSTNSYAKDLLADKKPIDGTLIFAFEQTQGRGQLGNVWHAGAGENITASYIFYPDFLQPQEQFYLNMAMSLAVCDFVQHFCKEKVFVKWPNDIIVSNKKVSGILIENSLTMSAITSTVVGVGVNINQVNFGENLAAATSLSLENRGEKYEVEELLCYLSVSLEKYYLLLRQRQFAQLKNAYLNVLWRYNVPADFRAKNAVFSATIVDITNEGKLCLDIAGRREEFAFKEIEFVY